MDEAGFLRVLSRLDGPCMIERSVKISGDQVSDGRLLVSAPRRALLQGAKRSFQTICSELGAPDVDALVPYLGMATDVHFGFEPGQQPVCKAYLEFGERSPIGGVRFMALKWRGTDGRTNLYFDRSALPAEARFALANAVIPDGPVRGMFAATMRQAMSAGPLHDIKLLLVEEEGSLRRSLDLNLADFGWRMRDLADAFGHLRGLSDERRIGHIAAGTGRGGEAFYTLYHDARPVVFSTGNRSL